jgi:catechol 2,3-dioxygenase-like lactoylglutathione lyase family enzyme
MAILTTSRLIGFAATAKPDEARRFYGEALGLDLVEDGPYALVYSAGGTTIRVQKVPRVAAAAYTTLGWAVDDMEATIAELTARGVKFEHFPGVPQSGSGVWRTPDGSSVAWFKDPDGNILSLTQYSNSDADIP